VVVTATDGMAQVTYRAPSLTLASNDSRTARVQVAGVNSVGEVTGLLGTATITLRNDGFCAPQPRGPEATGVNPADGATGVGLNAAVRAEFSQSLDPATVTSSTFRVTFFQNKLGINQQVPGTLTVSDGPRGPNTVVALTPSILLASNTSYTVSITTGIKNTEGNPLFRSFSSSFTTGVEADTGPPAVVQMNPVNGNTAAPLNSAVSVEFNEPMAPQSLTPQSFVLKVADSPVSGRVVVGSGVRGPNTIATFIPDQVLDPNTVFTVVLGTGATDAAGNPPASEFVGSFATAAADDTAQPSVMAVDPPNGANGVASDTAIMVNFDEPVNPITLNSSTFKVTFFSSFSVNVNVPGALAVANGGTTAVFVPSDPFFAGTNYRVELNNGIRDVAGNPLRSLFSSSFTTALSPGTGTLPITAGVLVNPPSLFANGKVPTTVTFSDIMNPNGALVPNGTRVALTAEPAFVPGAIGGVVSGSSVGPSVDGRFLLFETVGAEVPVFYTPPDLTGLPSGTTKTGVVQLSSVDASGRPVRALARGNVTLFGAESATVIANPTSLPANGTSMSTLTVTVKDRDGNLVPDGTPIGLAADPIYSVASAGGAITDGATSSADSRVQIFTTLNGQFTATYRSPSSRGSGTAVIQVLTVDPLGRPTSLVTASNIVLQ